MNYKPQINKEEFFRYSTGQDKIKFLLKYAILAPSTHNSQPWLFKIEENSCKIYSDPTVKIIEADPEGRDMYISIGCLIENLATASSYFGVLDKIEYQQGQEQNLIGKVSFNFEHPTTQRSLEPMLEAIINRINVRGVFDSKSISPENLNQLRSVVAEDSLGVNIFTDKGKINKMAKLTAMGLRGAYQSSSFRKEMSGWINNNFSKKLQGIPGYAMKMPAIISLILPKLIRRFNLGKPLSVLNYKSFSSAPVVCVISAEENNPKTWLNIGRTGQRIMLTANSIGLKTSIFVASVEIGDLYKEVQELIGTTSRPQFVFCIGYMGGPHRHTPRIPIENRLVTN